jgi:hypothetical protein
MASGSVNGHMADFFAELVTLAGRYKLLMETAEVAAPVVHAEELSVERPKKTRAKKDPNAPKRPMSAYLCFSMDARAKLKHEHPELKHPEEVMQAIGTMWEKIPDAERSKYTDKSERLKTEYAAKKQEYLRERSGAPGIPKKLEEQEVEEDDEDDDDDDDEDEEGHKSKKARMIK